MILTLPGPSVILLVGASGAGKSTLAARLLAARPDLGCVSYDAHQRRQPGDDGVRACTAGAIAAAHSELEARCAAGLSTVVDGTHRQPERRAAVRAIAATHHLPVIAIVLLVPLQDCLTQQHHRARQVPAADVAAQHASIAAALPHLHSEGYAATLVLTQSVVLAARAVCHEGTR
jgi:predicted kinase